jgi:hypothetical protein
MLKVVSGFSEEGRHTIELVRIGTDAEQVLSLLALLVQSTNTDAGAQFTCLTGIQVQILTQSRSASDVCRRRRTKVQILALYRLYWYKRKNTDAKGAADVTCCP